MAFVAALFTRITAALAFIATIYWIFIIKDAIHRDGVYPWSAFAFGVVAIPLGVGGLLLAFIPSWIALRHTQLRSDRVRMVVAGLSCLVILSEAAILLVAPARGE